MPSQFGPPVQLAYLVDDPAVAANRWETELGAGPFVIRDHIPVTDVIVHDEPAAFDHSSAYGWWGSVMVELFCQHGDDPGVTRDWRAQHGGRSNGIHHVACFVDDLDRALAAAAHSGLATTMTARAGEVTFAFVDDLVGAGHYWELYEPSAPLTAFYTHIELLHVTARGLDHDPHA